MILSLIAVVAVVGLGGAIAAGISVLIAIALAGVGLVGVANAVAVVGQLLDALDE